MTIQEEYKQKLTTAEEAVKVIKSGDWVDYGWCVCTANALDHALAARSEELTDVKLRGGVLMWMPEIAKVSNAAEHFTWNSWHMSGIERKMVSLGMAYYSPMRYSELPRFYRDHIIPNDVAMFQVAPMDEHGFFNFGVSATHMAAVCETSKHIIVEVNTNIPRCLGGFEEAVHISQVQAIVEGSNPPLAQLGGSATISPVDETVAKLIVEEIPNGACLQLGIGNMPNAVGTMIANSDLRDLGVHSEMYVDAFVDIAMAGKITGSKKNFDRGRQAFTFGAGTQKLYDYVHNNPAIMAAPSNYTNAVSVIAGLDNFISINNAVNLDLFGQVNAESAGTKQISGTGGQLDFVLGAYRSNGGKSFICLSSSYTDKNGELRSRIMPTLTNGSITTDPRTCAEYLVTEYGKINLKGLSTWQRAEAIISIAHPNFREQLIADAEKMGIWRRTNK